VLIKSLKTARDQKTLFAACENALLGHLKAVCLWRAAERNRTWRIGDYSYYVMEFEPLPGMLVYVQFWSQPGDPDGVRFEVSSGARNRPAARYVTADRQELLRDRGFEIGGSAGNFRKAIHVESTRDVRAAAREAIALLVGALGYDGRQDLCFTLHLGTQSEPRHVYQRLAPDDFVSLLREWGYAADLEVRDDNVPVILSRTDHGPFAMVLFDSVKPGLYQSATLRTVPKLEDLEQAAGVANAINRKFRLLQAHVDGDGDLILESVLTLMGGVTAEHMRRRLDLWRDMLRALAGADGVSHDDV
jgi:hypothetical protein